MKIVASTRMGKAQRAMAAAKVFNESDAEFQKNAEPETVPDKKTLLIAVSSDKGLCGSIHTQIAKFTKKRIEELNGNVDVVAVGDKVKTQLLRTHGDNIKLAFAGILKQEPNFAEASALAAEIQALGEYDNVEVLYNRFLSGIAFEPSKFGVFNAEAIEKAPGISKYELEGEDIPEALAEFSLANTLLTAMSEGYASEISARRNAMENASKNAGDMINSYTILYNRQRQAVITNELVDIITGASSLD